MCICISSKRVKDTKFGINILRRPKKKKKKKKYCRGLHTSIISNTVHLLLT